MPDYMHIESQLRKRELQDGEKKPDRSYSGNNGALKASDFLQTRRTRVGRDFIRTYGKIERKNAPGPRRVISEKRKKNKSVKKFRNICL